MVQRSGGGQNQKTANKGVKADVGNAERLPTSPTYAYTHR